MLLIFFLQILFNDLKITGFLQKYGKIDVVVSNAAVNPSKVSVLQTQESVLNKLWEINVKASILVLQVKQLRNICYSEPFTINYQIVSIVITKYFKNRMLLLT